jgi:hypothetical protein
VCAVRPEQPSAPQALSGRETNPGRRTEPRRGGAKEMAQTLEDSPQARSVATSGRGVNAARTSDETAGLD